MFKTLQNQINSFIRSFKELWKPFVPFFSIVLLYASVGLYIFHGLLESRCRLSPLPELDPYSWKVDETNQLPCGSLQCPSNTYCRNPSDYDLPKIPSDKNSLLLYFGFPNFDTIFQAIYTVQSFFTINGWIVIVQMFWRAQDKTVSGIYFCTLVILLAHIFGNIVLATLHESFVEHHFISNEQSHESHSDKKVYNLRYMLQQEMEEFALKQQQSNVNQFDQLKRRKSFFNKILNVTIQNIVQETEIKSLPPSSFFWKIFRLYLKKIKKSLAYKSIRFINIIIQTVILCLDRQILSIFIVFQYILKNIIIIFKLYFYSILRYEVSNNQLKIFNIIDFASTIILFVEIPFEILSNGWTKYWKENLNRIDLLIGILHVMIYAIEIHNQMDLFSIESQFSIFIRSTKILRLYRLFYSFTIFESIKVILKTYAKTLKMIPGYFVLVFILIILYAMVGRELFSEKVSNSTMRINFNSITDSLIAVILFCYNEEWHIVMYEYYHYAGYKGIIFSLFCIYTCQVIFVRLFIAIFIHNFMNWLRFFEQQFQASSPYINHMSNVIKKFFRKVAQYLKRRHLKNQELKKRKSMLNEFRKNLEQIFEQNAAQLLSSNNLNKNPGVARCETLQNNTNKIINRQRQNTNLETSENFTSGQQLFKKSTLPNYINKQDQFIQDSFFGAQNNHNASKFKELKYNEDIISPQSEASDVMIFKQNYRESVFSKNGANNNNSLIKFQQQLMKQQQQFQNSLQQTPYNESINNSETFQLHNFPLKSPVERVFSDRLIVPEIAQSQKEQSSCQSSVIIQQGSDPNQFLKEVDQQRKYYSVFIFSPLNKIRSICKIIASHKYFYRIKPFLLILFGLIQAMQEPYLDPKSDFSIVLYQIDFALMIVFNVQTIIFTIAYGAVLQIGEKDVIINFNNFFEIILNITHFLYFMPLSSKDIYNLRFFKIIRLLLLLPFLSEYSQQISFAGRVYIACLPRMLKILIFAIIYMFINSVFVTKLMKGQMQNCNYNKDELKDIKIQNKQDCFDYGGDWINMYYQFNDVLQTMSVLFMVQTSEGWLVIMLQQFDSSQPDQQPQVQHYSPWILFYIQFFFISNICILNMFVGLVVDTFRELKEHECKIDTLTLQQKEWYYIKKSIYNLKPQPFVNPPNNKLGKLLFVELNQGKILRGIFYGFSILNCVAIFGFYHRQSESTNIVLNKLNLVCMIVGAIEILLKVFIFRKTYFKSYWSWFNIINLICGFINIYYQIHVKIKSYDEFHRIFGGISKGLQLVRVYRILLESKVMKKLLNSFFGAVSSIAGISVLVLYFLFISVIFAMNLFPYVKNQIVLNNYDLNFTSFLMSLNTLARIISMEYWFPIVTEASSQISPSFVCRSDIYSYDDYIQYGQQACGSSVSHFFFFIFFLAFTLFILNLLIASIILSYKEAYIQEESAINLYQLQDIKKLWQNFDPEGIGFMSYKLFWQFSSQIALIFGVLPDDLLDISLKKKFLYTLNIPMFEDPVHQTLVYKFHDVVVSLAEISLKIKYRIKNLEPENKDIKKFHKKTLKQQTLNQEKQIVKSMFRSRDMVVIITILKKIKEWKKRYLEKEEDFKFFDLKNLTQKLQFQKQKSELPISDQSPQVIEEQIIQKDVFPKEKEKKSNLKPVESYQIRKSVQFENRIVESHNYSSTNEVHTPQQRKSANPCINYSIFITPHIDPQPNKQPDDNKSTVNEIKLGADSPNVLTKSPKNIKDQIPKLKIDNFIHQEKQPIINQNENNEKKEKNGKSKSPLKSFLNKNGEKRRRSSNKNNRSQNQNKNDMFVDIADCALSYHYTDESVQNKVQEDNFIYAFDGEDQEQQQTPYEQEQTPYQQEHTPYQQEQTKGEIPSSQSQSSFSETSSSQKSSSVQSRSNYQFPIQRFS